MRPLILKMEMSLDGFVGEPDEKPGWPVDYYDDKMSAYMLDLIGSVGVHAMDQGPTSRWRRTGSHPPRTSPSR